MDERRVAIVTGAGSGIGSALAVSMAPDFDLVLVGRRRDRLDATAAAAAPAAAREPLVVAADLTHDGAPAAVVAAALDRFGRVDVLINNAGLARFASLADVVPRDVAAMLGTHLVAPLVLIEAAASSLRARRGVVVNVGSVGGILALPHRSVYGASKAALHHLTRSLAKELAPDIRVNAVVPGAIDTEIYGHLGLSEEKTAALLQQMLATTPMGRLGTPQDVVPWIRMLLGPAGEWVTGSLIVVDGGRSC